MRMNLELFKYPKHIKEFKGILKINCMDCGNYGVIYNHQIGEGIADREITLALVSIVHIVIQEKPFHRDTCLLTMMIYKKIYSKLNYE